jgi:predicted transcriptional regulator
MARRTTAQRTKDLERTAELYLRGVRQSEIAEQMGVSQQTVSNDLQALYAEWRESALVDMDAAKSRELARIDELERTYWAEWEKSQTRREVTQTKKSEGKEARSEASVRREDRLGDPRYLAGVQWCIERRCAILGINAPTKMAHTGADGGAIETKGSVTLDLSGLSAEQLAGLVQSLTD